jgi:hypothetical protein
MCQRMDVLCQRPQSFFGVPSHLRSSKGYTKASAKLKFVDTGKLPTAKIGALIETAQAIFEEVFFFFSFFIIKQHGTLPPPPFLVIYNMCMHTCKHVIYTYMCIVPG